ncbi:gamma-type small acid-soluble spore protein [Salirhabdus salicampi]|uniref:gamma-type small acid-soluble spore protein n=1 Tax=Salirhabdus salicampi TaxID=476102 RepID=UPI0020C293CA|nr:gamma-type small acid-soluble spore protein [Salirhabdus salicampi]MCP8617341.1 gamma-type small acid-soluble spore protein [Salirhabdus salicampi]
MNNENRTDVGTDIDEVKRLNAQSGLSYNEVKQLLVEAGGSGTAKYSDTDVQAIKQKLTAKKKT